MSGMAFHVVYWGIPLNRVSFVDRDQWASPNHHMKGYSRHNSSLIGHKNQAKFENDFVLRNSHRVNITQPNSMILVSFSSVEDVSFDDVKRYCTFRSQGTENLPFRFLWDTRYIHLPQNEWNVPYAYILCEHMLCVVSKRPLPMNCSIMCFYLYL